jgi:hemerythrin
MAPRHTTIVAYIEKAISQIENDRCPNALRTLQSLDNKLNNKKKSPKKPNAYAEFVKKQYPHFKKEHPHLEATGIMPLIAAAWKKHKNEK